MEEVYKVEDWFRKEELGSGGFGIVSLWKNKSTHQSIAIKKCRWSLQSNLTPKHRHRWTAEVEMMKTTNHINIVSFQKIPEVLEIALLKHNPSNLPILSMEYCSKGNLRDVLNLPQNSCGLLEIEVKDVSKDIANALSYLHDLKITHRDVKPENIVLQTCDNRPTAVVYKLIDLGYAKELESICASFVGTLQYLAPEMFVLKEYNCGVDYWSYGITLFEIICGVRPFLPNMTPVECFKFVEKKASEDICIYITHSNSIIYSREILQEHNISSCLKHHIEKWLRKALEYEPNKRSGSINEYSFKTIQDIISKKIITVFSVYTYEFYSYEIDDSTLLSTLQDWIARDSKIKKSDQILIATIQIRVNADTLAVEFYDQMSAGAMIFIFKTGAFINDVFPVLPELVKLMFEEPKSASAQTVIKKSYAHAMHYVSQETKHFDAMTIACDLYSESISTLVNKFLTIIKEIENDFKNIIFETEFYTMLEKQLFKVYETCGTSETLIKYLHDHKTYMCHLKYLLSDANELLAKKKLVEYNNRLKNAAAREAFSAFEECNMHSLYDEALECYKSLIKDGGQSIFSCKTIVKILSNTLKCRDNLVRNKELVKYFTAQSHFSKLLNACITPAVSIRNGLKATITSIRNNKIKQLIFIQDLNTVKEHCNNVLPNNNNLLDINTDELISENIRLRYKLQNLINESLSKHKQYLEEVRRQMARNGADYSEADVCVK